MSDMIRERALRMIADAMGVERDDGSDGYSTPLPELSQADIGFLHQQISYAQGAVDAAQSYASVAEHPKVQQVAQSVISAHGPIIRKMQAMVGWGPGDVTPPSVETLPYV